MKRHLVLPYPPSANNYWRSVAVRAGPKWVARVLKSEEARSYQKAVAAQLAGLAPETSEVVVEFHVYRPRRIGDLDNALKVLMDALKGFAFVDDSQVVQLSAHRHDDKQNPRVEVWVGARP
ncbi:MAG: RusA family crossover junction endodeoxyribonuclease [Myxococcaceae bacterium]|nr:RusA family crossover junction endodeoxyribonuclease [Myxococcaceae bacterium]